MLTFSIRGRQMGKAGRLGSPSFFSPYRHGFVRVATAVPKVKLADPAANAQSILALAREAHEAGVAVIGGPDFGVCGEGYIRLSYANSTENIVKAMDH